MKFINRKSAEGRNEKRMFAAKISSAIALYLCVILIIGFAGCSAKDKNNENTTETTLSETEINIDENTYTFSDKVTIGTLSASGKTYNEIKKAAEKELKGQIKDFEITVTAGKEKHILKRDDFTFDNNIDDILKQAVRYNDSSNSESKTFKFTFEVNEKSVGKKVAELAKKIDSDPVDATISSASNKKVTISKAQNGKKLDQDKLTKELVTLINPLSKGEKAETTVKASITTTKPKVTAGDLDGKITLLSSFTTVSTNTADGNHNMALALDACDGSVILPGETWSFNDCTGNSNLTSLGYRPATVIVGGKLVQGIGGGLCQSSTTIYNAAIRTNMVIVERYCHYFQSTYVDAGLDATIDWPSLDLKLKNPTEYPMYMQCYMSGTTLYCNIYGYQDPSFDKVEVSSYIYDANYEANYYKAAATRTFYKNGKVVLEEQLPYSKYHYKSPSDETTAPSTAAPTKPVPTKPVSTAPVTNPTTPVTKPTTPVTTPPTTQAPQTQAPNTQTPSAPIPSSTQPVEY